MEYIFFLGLPNEKPAHYMKFGSGFAVANRGDVIYIERLFLINHFLEYMPYGFVDNINGITKNEPSTVYARRKPNGFGANRNNWRIVCLIVTI